MNSIKVCEYSRSRSFHDDLILQDQASGERSQDHWSSGYILGDATCGKSSICQVFHSDGSFYPKNYTMVSCSGTLTILCRVSLKLIIWHAITCT